MFMQDINGIDVSRYDGGGDIDGNPLLETVQWNQYAAAGWPYGYIKATEGSSYIDSLFAEQWKAARGHIYRGAYHFFHPSVSPTVAVNKFLETLGDDLGELRVVLDLETTDGRDDTASRALSWLELYESITGERPIIYSASGFLYDIQAAKHPAFNKYRLWLAQYYNRFETESEPKRSENINAELSGATVAPWPNTPAPFYSVDIWQWTSKGSPESVPGYYNGAGKKSAVDLNKFRGSLQEFKNLFMLREIAEGIPEMPESNETYSITPIFPDGSSLRKSAAVLPDNKIGALSYGSIAYGSNKIIKSETESWLEIVDINGSPIAENGGSLFVAIMYNGKNVGKLTQINFPPNPPTEGETIVTLESMLINIDGERYEIKNVQANKI